MTNPLPTAFVFDERYLWHDSGNAAYVMTPGEFVEPYRHIESPDAKRRFYNLLRTSGLLAHLEELAPRPATDEELLAVHTPAYLQHVKDVSRTGGEVGFGTRIGAGGFEIARLAAGGAITAIDAVAGGRARNAYALVRPPGHHAEPGAAMGFCIFANGAIAAHRARAQFGVERIAFVDWDVHQGNGTQAAFWTDPTVLTISIHQEAMFPAGRGYEGEIGAEAGRGYSINIPLAPGCGEGAYLHAFERIVVPSLEAFRPELIIVPSGFDAGMFDPLARMLLWTGAYRRLAAMMVDAAARLCSGRLALIHEGGYCPATVPFLGLAVVETLAAIRTKVTCPLDAAHAAMPGQRLQPHQREHIDRLAGHFDAVRRECWR